MGFGSSKPQPLPENMKAVIVGGGYGGAQMARNLQGRCQVVLIDPKDAFHHNMGALRAAVEPGFVLKTLIPYKKSFGDNFKRGLVTAIDPDNNCVTLENGEKIPYTHLVIATGSAGPFPGKLTSPMNISMEEAGKMYAGIAKEIADAENVVVVGGGPVGVELAGEIATDYAGKKKVTLIHPHDKIADPMTNEKFQSTLKGQLKDLGVNLVLGERVSNLKSLPLGYTTNTLTTVRTDKGQEIEANLVLPCTGLKTNTTAYGTSLGDKMDTNGRLKVNEFLQVNGHKNIYAIGDCADVKETKLAYNAGVHADAVTKNLENEAAGKELKPYKPGGFFMALSCGRNNGIMTTGGYVIGSFIAKRIKSKEVFVPMTWKKMGQPVPEVK
ncbi:ferroptosis suppressor protein 1-like [Ptychodera flava]|uniref:ferroptosis suppressor protein 1-like n=1 Tax=Ptychodera flava TaxID=63121 RepID=UPI00396AA754